jgi:hypothetical protein
VGATAALMRDIDMLRDMLPGTPDPLGVRFSSAGIFGLVKQETLPCYHRQQRAVRPDPRRSAAAAM